MPDIYVKDNYCTYYVDKILTSLITKYGDVINERPKITSGRPFAERIQQFVTNENIIALINTGDICGIGYRELYNYVVYLNDLLLSVYNFVSDTESHQPEYKAMCELNGAMYSIKEFNEVIADMNRVIGKKIKHKFILNVVPRLRLIDIKPRINSMYEL
jgi:hypothetical protein